MMDLFFTFRKARDEYRAIIEEEEGRSVLVYLECDKATLWKGIQAREKAGLDADSAYKMTLERLELHLGGFEVPVDEWQVVINRSDEST